MTAPRFIRPTKTKKVSDDFHDHIARGSVNPGTDYVVGVGTPVYAIADGTVVGVTTSIAGAGGRMVWLNMADGYNADYLHLSKISVKKGAKVKQGDLLGYSGASGRGSEHGYGAHLHLAVRKGGKHVNGKGNFDFEAYLKKQSQPAAAKPANAAPNPATPVPTGKPALKGSLTIGSKGPLVKWLQRALHLTADGSFGPKTKAAVVKFQRTHGLKPDGIVGPATWAAL